MDRPFIELSYSRMKELLCPWRFAQLYLLGVDEPDSDDAMAGTIIHAAAAAYGQHLAEHKFTTDIDWWNANIGAFILRAPSHMRQEMNECAANYVAAMSLNPRADEHLFEQRYALRIPEFTPCELTDKCDKVAGTLDMVSVLSFGTKAEILDYKMGYRMIEYDEVGVDPQLRLYAWLWLKTHPDCRSVVTTLWAPRWGGKNKSEYEFTIEDLDSECQSLVLAVMKSIELRLEAAPPEQWECKPNWQACRYCSLDCPLVSQYQLLEAM